MKHHIPAGKKELDFSQLSLSTHRDDKDARYVAAQYDGLIRDILHISCCIQSVTTDILAYAPGSVC